MHTIVYEPRLFLSTRRGKDTLHIIDIINIIITIDIIDIIDIIPGHANLLTLLNFGEADSWSHIVFTKTNATYLMFATAVLSEFFLSVVLRRFMVLGEMSTPMTIPKVIKFICRNRERISLLNQEDATLAVMLCGCFKRFQNVL